jgi:hypothetical protein
LQIRGDNRRAFGRQPPTDRLTNPAARARHQRHAAFEALHLFRFS